MRKAWVSLFIFGCLLLVACGSAAETDVDMNSETDDSNRAGSETESEMDVTPRTYFEASPTIEETEEWIVAEKRTVKHAVNAEGTPLNKAGTPGVPEFPDEINGCKIERRTNCEGLDLSGVDLAGYRATGHSPAVLADFRNSNLRNINFTDAELQKAKFDEADLRGANFTGAQLSESSLYAADLRGADFTDAILTYSDMEDAQIEGAIFCRTTMADFTVNDEGC